MQDPNAMISQVTEGADVYCADGEKVGSVGDVNIGTTPGEVTSQTITEERSYFQVRRGLLGLGNDLWVPADQIQAVDGDRVTLRCSSGELSTVAYDEEPVTPGTPGAGAATDDGTVLPAAGLAATGGAGGPATGTGTGTGPL